MDGKNDDESQAEDAPVVSVAEASVLSAQEVGNASCCFRIFRLELRESML